MSDTALQVGLILLIVPIPAWLAYRHAGSYRAIVTVLLPALLLGWVIALVFLLIVIGAHLRVLNDLAQRERLHSETLTGTLRNGVERLTSDWTALEQVGFIGLGIWAYLILLAFLPNMGIQPRKNQATD